VVAQRSPRLAPYLPCERQCLGEPLFLEQPSGGGEFGLQGSEGVGDMVAQAVEPGGGEVECPFRLWAGPEPFRSHPGESRAHGAQRVARGSLIFLPGLPRTGAKRWSGDERLDSAGETLRKPLRLLFGEERGQGNELGRQPLLGGEEFQRLGAAGARLLAFREVR